MSAVFFTDRDLGFQFPSILKRAGLAVERHADHFAPDCADDVWLAAVARHGWVAVTHDSRIRYKPNELAAVIAHRVRLLVVVGRAPYQDLARNFVVTVPQITEFLTQYPAPVIEKVLRPSPSDLRRNPAARGSVTLWYPRPNRD